MPKQGKAGASQGLPLQKLLFVLQFFQPQPGRQKPQNQGHQQGNNNSKQGKQKGGSPEQKVSWGPAPEQAALQQNGWNGQPQQPNIPPQPAKPPMQDGFAPNGAQNAAPWSQEPNPASEPAPVSQSPKAAEPAQQNPWETQAAPWNQPQPEAPAESPWAQGPPQAEQPQPWNVPQPEETPQSPWEQPQGQATAPWEQPQQAQVPPQQPSQTQQPWGQKPPAQPWGQQNTAPQQPWPQQPSQPQAQQPCGQPHNQCPQQGWGAPQPQAPMPFNGQQPFENQEDNSKNDIPGHSDPLSFLSKRKRGGDHDAERVKKFQNEANQDGYYDDRRPQDDNEYMYTGHRSMLPTILCIIGVVAFTCIVIYLKSKLG